MLIVVSDIVRPLHRNHLFKNLFSHRKAKWNYSWRKEYFQNLMKKKTNRRSMGMATSCCYITDKDSDDAQGSGFTYSHASTSLCHSTYSLKPLCPLSLFFFLSFKIVFSENFIIYVDSYQHSWGYQMILFYLKTFLTGSSDWCSDGITAVECKTWRDKRSSGTKARWTHRISSLDW